MLGDKKEPGMTFIIKAVTRLTLPFILLYGFYLALNGKISPGGGFAGGVIMALFFVNSMLAFGKEKALKLFNPTRLRIGASLAAIVFLWTVFMRGNGFFSILDTEIIISLCDMIIVGFGLFAIFITLLYVTGEKRNGT